MDLNDILDELERPTLSDESETSDEDESIGMVKQTETHDVYIMPANDGAVTDEDSGEEESVDISNLPGTQLTAFAVLDSTVSQDEVDENGERQASQKKKIIKLRKWKAQDLPEKTNVPCYPYKPSVADIPRKSSETLELFLDVLAIDHLVKQTVNYAVQNGKHSFTLTSDEMKTFIGILLVSGYCCVPRRRLYWQRQPDVYNELIANSMRRDRFDEIMKYFHAADNTNLPKNDKYGKVSPLIEILNGNFLKYGEVFGPINISIDESMIPYFGRYPTKQFIRGKPVRWGYKAWVAADPNGYVFDISVYQGKDGAKDKANASYGLGGKVVLDVLDVIEKRYPTKKLSLYFDNFFTSLKLVEKIKSKGHDATGTLRKNRIEKCPFTNPAKFMKLSRGTEEHFCDAESGIIAARWQDNGIVTIASSEYGVSPLVKAERYVASQKKRMNVLMPNAIHQYNRKMGGVDRVDQNIAQYRPSIRGKKWYFPIATYLFTVCVNNAWIFAREGGYKEDMLSFLRAAATEWLQNHGKKPNNPGRSRSVLSVAGVSAQMRYDNVGHHIVKSDPPKRCRCRLCNSQTVFICQKCKVYLHQKCSVQYHTM